MGLLAPGVVLSAVFIVVLAVLPPVITGSGPGFYFIPAFFVRFGMIFTPGQAPQAMSFSFTGFLSAGYLNVNDAAWPVGKVSVLRAVGTKPLAADDAFFLF